MNETIRDDGELLTLFEPLMVGQEAPQRAKLNDLALDLATRSTAFKSALPSAVVRPLAELIRSMNCYYSNLIEGHNTHPVDIERALRNEYSEDLEKRNLQLEAKAHIAVQQWIDDEGIEPTQATAPIVIAEIHKKFYELMPEELLWVDDPSNQRKLKIIPGQFRTRDVKVGRHVAISPGAIPRFLNRFHDFYSNTGRIESVLAAACAHHRLLWIHPFLDGNGRVARLMSYAMLRHSLDTQGLWSVARGLARNDTTYKRQLMNCDSTRRGDLDGRGSLSESALSEFIDFFLNTCIDQVDFMESLMKPNRFNDRVKAWVAMEIRDGNLPARSDTVMGILLSQGSLSRGELAGILGINDRSARRVTSALINTGAISSSSSRAPLRLSLPANLASIWLPGLLPE